MNEVSSRPWLRISVSRRWCRFFAIPLAALFVSAPISQAIAQSRPLVFENLQAIGTDGSVITELKLSVQRGKLTGVGTQVSSPLFAKKIDAKGKFVTSGLIDAWCDFDVLSGSRGGAPATSAADAFDPYDDNFLRSAWSQGVVAVFVSAASSEGAAGRSAVIKLTGTHDRDEWLANEDAAVCFTIDDQSSRAFQQVRALKQFRDAIESARAYRVALEDYEEDLKEYEEKIAERAKKQAEADKKEGAEKKDEKSGKEDSKEKKTKGKKKKQEAPPKGVSALVNPDEPSLPEKPEEKPESTDKAADKKEKKTGKIEKPKKPPFDANLALIVRALDGELPVRVLVNRPENILEVVEIARLYGLRLVLEGASGAHRVADVLAENDVAVVLGPAVETMFFQSGALEYYDETAAAQLANAGVDVFFGTGPRSPSGFLGTNLLLQVANAVSHGFPDDKALASLNRDALPFLGVEKKVGRIRPSEAADFVLWSDNPFAAGATVEAVYVDGREVYRRADAEESES